jgi:hypothetical protein
LAEVGFNEVNAQKILCPSSPRPGGCNVRKPTQMPLPNITSGKTRRCTAKCKARGGDLCFNPAAYGMRVCRYHGARKPEAINRGANHPQYRHGGETLHAKVERHQMSVFFHETESLMFALDMVAPGSTRTRGRKPR